MLRYLHRRLLFSRMVLGGLSLFLLITLPSTLVAAAPGEAPLQPARNSRAAAFTDQSNASTIGLLAPDAPDATYSTTTTITEDLTDPSVVGQGYWIRFEMRVHGNDTDAPAGTVTVTDGTGASCSKYSDGYDSEGPMIYGWTSGCTLTSTTVGVKLIVASWTPDDPDLFESSVSIPEPHTVNKASTTTAVTYSPTSPKACANITLTATVSPVSPGGGTPSSGTVTFYEGTTVLGTGTYSTSGQWSLVTTLTAGWHSVHAVYAGNANYNGSTAPVNLFDVGKADSTTTVTTLAPNPSTFGNAVTVRATSSGGCGVPTGTVNFYDSASPIGSATLNGSGVADLIVNNFSVGDHTLKATYTGDSTYAGDTSGDHTHTVNKRNVSSVTVTSSLNPSIYGQSITFTANVTSDISTKPTGQVIFKDGVNSLGTRTLDASGQATLSTSSLIVGSHSITVEYQGDTNFNTGTSPALTQQVNKANTSTALTSSSSPSTYGQSVSFTATVTAVSPGGGTPTGSVTFKDGGTTIGTDALNGSGQATLNTSSLGVGLHFITADYGGSSNFNGSSSNYIIFQVDKANTSTALASSGSPSVYGQSVTFTATVSVLSGSGTPTGTVMFKDGGVPIGAGALNGAGQASFSTSSLAVGSHSISAEYMGDSNFNGSVSSSQTHQVNKASSATTLYASPSTSTVGQTVVFTATITAVAPGSGTPGGIVIFKDGDIPLATVFLSGSGRAVFSTTSLEAGSHSITAEYGGDTSFNGSLSSPVVVNMLTQADVSIEKTGGPGTAYAGEQIQYQVWTTNNGPSDAQDVMVLDVLPDEVSYQIDSSSGSCTQPVDLTGLRAVLNGANEVPPVSTPASGLATLVLDTTTNRLTYAIQVSQIGTITAAHIQTGAAGVNGSILVTLYNGTPLFDPTHPLVGSIDLSPADAAAILANPAGYYINVQTSSFPSGEIRGQLAQTLNTPLKCELGIIQTNLSRHFDVYATTSPEATPNTIMTNVAIVSSASDLGDPVPWNNVSRADNLLQGKADLKVTKYGNPSHEVRAGERLTYTVMVDNLGPGIAHTVTLTDVLQSSGSFHLLSVDSDRPAICAPTSGSFTGQMEVRCDLTDPLEVMTPSDSGRWKLIMIVTAEESQSINNTAHVVGADLDPNLSNNQAFVEHDITDVADLSIVKTAVGEVQEDGQPGGTVILTPDQVTAGRILTYTLTINNQGPSTAENVTAQDRLPAWIEVLDIIPSQGSCNWGTPGDPWDKMTCGMGALSPFQSAAIIIRMKIPSWVANETILRNDALVFSDVFDPNNADNFAFNQVTVDAWADLSISKVQMPEIALPDQAITYTITVSNTGPSDAPGALVVDLAPSELIDVTWKCTASSQATCTASGAGDIDEAVGLPSGETITYTLWGTVSSFFPFTNTVSVDAPLGIPDPYLLNNLASSTNIPYLYFLPLISKLAP